MSIFNRRRGERPQAAPAAPLSTGYGHDYVANFSDPEVDHAAFTAGSTSQHDPGVFGPNATDVFHVEELVAAHGVESHLIGHRLRQTLAAIYAVLATLVTVARETMVTAKEAIDDHFDKAVKQVELSQRIEAEGLGFPHWVAHSLLYTLALLGLVLGDLAFIAVAYQLFGLSDGRLFGIPYTDELHLAASASVGGLVVLAHLAGKQLRGVLHCLDRRRRATKTEREALPRVSRAAVVIAGVCIVAAVVMLMGIAEIRASYLGAAGKSAESWPFAAIQGGVFIAALGLAIAHAHPYGREWVDIGRHVKRTRKAMIAACQGHAGAVADVNAQIDRGNAEIAGAGHHLGAAMYNVRRQAVRWAGGMLRALPEPVADARLLPEKLPLPAPRSDAEAAAFLVGITGLPQLQRMTTDEVTQHREEGRRRIEEMRAGRLVAAPETSAGTPMPLWVGFGSPVESTVATTNGANGNGGGH